jgi:hypothetical protein
MIKIVIYGFEIIITKGNIHIPNSYNVDSPIIMGEILEELKHQLDDSTITMDTPFNHRSIDSMINEWIAHNNLYKIGYKPERTGSIDLDYPQAWYIKLGYWLLSRFIL